MEKERKVRIVALSLLVVSIITLSIAFAMLSRKLDITGSASVDPINWKIYFDNISEVEKQGEAAVVSNPKIDSNIKTKITNFNVILNKPGDKATFTVDLVNESDITAIIDKIDTPTINYDFIEFNAMYTDNDRKVEIGDVIEAKTDNEESRANIEISVYFSRKKVTNEDLKNIPAEGLEITFSYALTFVQSDKVANMPTTTKWINGCTEFTKKDTYAVGDLIAFCNTDTNKSEDFYVIKDNGDTVTALARYNLMVGNKIIYDDSFENVLLNTVLTSSDKDYGLQSELTKFEINEEGLPASTTLNGFIAFANKDENNKDSSGEYLGYWTNITKTPEGNGIPLEKYGTSYPANVFDENSLLWEPIQNYKSYFTSTLNKSTAKMRLITYDELVNLGCDATEYKCTKDFVYQGLNYWSSTARDYNSVVFVDAYGRIDYDIFSSSFFGVRPIITISKSEI